MKNLIVIGVVFTSLSCTNMNSRPSSNNDLLIVDQCRAQVYKKGVNVNGRTVYDYSSAQRVDKDFTKWMNDVYAKYVLIGQQPNLPTRYKGVSKARGEVNACIKENS